MVSSLGFLGAGHLASYTVQGLRRGGFDGPILLSPRNAQVAADLAARFDAEVAPSNQAVVDRCEAVVLSVRPDRAEALLQGLRFRPGQLVVSVMAGVSLASLRACGALAEVELVRSLPLQSAAVGEGPLPLYPAHATAEALLRPLGSVVVLSSESQFEIAASLACMNGWLYPWLASMSDWACARGLEPGAAADLTRAAVSGATAYCRDMDAEAMAAVGESIATEGTYTLAGLTRLREGGGLEAWTQALEAVLARANDPAAGDD